MKRKLSITILLLLIIALLSGCCVNHEWQEATCETPKTCVKCQEIKGQPTDHIWMNADCTTPRTCSNCGKTQGNPLGHTPGDATERLEVIDAEFVRETVCIECSERIDVEREPLNSFADGSWFIFSPSAFLERFSYIAKEQFPAFRYEIVENNGDMYVRIVFNEEDLVQYVVMFHNHDASLISLDDIDIPGLWGISLSAQSTCGRDSFDPMQVLLSTEMVDVFCRTLDLTFDDDDRKLMSGLRVTCLLNALSTGRPDGYSECGELYYEIWHSFVLDEPSETVIAIHSLVAHPTEIDFDAND